MIEKRRNRWVYTDEPTGARFRLTKEELHNHSIALRPSHLYIVENPNKIPTSELKQQLIKTWFGSENEMYKKVKNEK
tara:strand:+ start:16956 stop:17186 length:231 start_codon:yes stop_codon:yes gene_type:complete